MSQLSFGLRIGAKNDTQGALRGSLAGVMAFARKAAKPIIIPLKIARGGLALLRDINVGLAPLVAGLDRVIERGTKLEVVRKSFESLTGKSGRQVRALARELVRASSGTLSLAKAMQIANRGMGSGLSLRQLGTAIEFISKKAITTGKNAEHAIDTVITGLSRGSTLFLDDFGILVDGIEGVGRTFDAIKGAGAFDSLGPAAKKAETIRQAIVEMQGQMGRIGISGKETIFVFKGLKNEIGNMVDKLFMAVGRTGALKAAMEGLRDVVAGMVEHFERGVSDTPLMDILFGKKGGKSGGLFGLLKAGAMDLGEALGRGILGGMLKALSGATSLLSLLSKVWDPPAPEGVGYGATFFPGMPAAPTPNSGAAKTGMPRFPRDYDRDSPIPAPLGAGFGFGFGLDQPKNMGKLDRIAFAIRRAA